MEVEPAPDWLVRLAEAYSTAGAVDEGVSVLVEALDAGEQTGERTCEAEVYRLKGEFVLQSRVQSPDSEAEECFQKAIEIARRQGAKSWQLRATTSLARLWQQQGKKKAARRLLDEVYAWFTEGFDTADLKDAQALLEDLS